MVLFIILYKVVLTFESVGEILKCDHANESYHNKQLWYCLLCCTRWFYLLSLWMKCYSVTIQMKAIEKYLPVVLLYSCAFNTSGSNL